MAATTHEEIEVLGRWRVRRHRLPNGLRVLLMADPRTPLISFHTWFQVGSRDEREGKTGLAHLFEHLMFESTLRHGSGQFDREMERFGADTNAATWLDWTYYHETFPPEALPTVLDFEPDRMVNLSLTDEVVAREKSVVMNERKFRVEDRVEGQAEELLYRTAFRVHPYGHPTIGWMQDIEGFTREDCTAFYETYYSPANALVVVTGCFDHDRMLGELLDRYGPLPARQVPGGALPPEPPQETERRVSIRREATSPKVLAGYHAPPIGHPDNAALSVLGLVLAGGESGRLVRTFIHEEETASDVSAWVGNFAHPGLFELQLDLREGEDPHASLSLLDRELGRVIDGGVTADEVTTAQNRVLLGTYGGMAGAGGKASVLGFYESVLGDCAAVTARLAALRGVTPERVRDAAAAYLAAERRTVVTVLAEDA